MTSKFQEKQGKKRKEMLGARNFWPYFKNYKFKPKYFNNLRLCPHIRIIKYAYFLALVKNTCVQTKTHIEPCLLQNFARYVELMLKENNAQSTCDADAMLTSCTAAR